MDLVEFLTARLDEDEQTALAASPGPWRPGEEHDEVVAVDDIVVAEGFALSGRQLRATVDHIARYDPVRVLAEVDAKRRILAGITEADPHGAHITGTFTAWDVLHLLALPYAAHPDHDEAWRP